jgi:hypothetical protein
VWTETLLEGEIDVNTELIVEYENGEVHKEQPENIIFADSKEYVFPRVEVENESI